MNKNSGAELQLLISPHDKLLIFLAAVIDDHCKFSVLEKKAASKLPRLLFDVLPRWQWLRRLLRLPQTNCPRLVVNYQKHTRPLFGPTSLLKRSELAKSTAHRRNAEQGATGSELQKASIMCFSVQWTAWSTGRKIFAGTLHRVQHVCIYLSTLPDAVHDLGDPRGAAASGCFIARP